LITDYDTVLHENILADKLALEAAKLTLLGTVAAVQQECTHTLVGVCDYQKLEWFPSLRPIRICLQCRLEEEAPGTYSNIRGNWGSVISNKYALDPSPTRIYVEMERNKLMNLRVR
jgi:hypothetical protein